MGPGWHGLRSARWPLLGLGGVGLIVAVIVVVAGIGQAGGRACASVFSAAGAAAGTVQAGAAAGTARAGTIAADAQAGVVAGTARAGAVTGTATHYVLSGTGNCSYPSPPSDGLFVALSPSEYNGAAACGSYIQVSGPSGSVRAEVIDQCPPCAAGHIDLSEAAFSRIAPLSAGLVPVTYQAVTDPALPAPISLRVKEGSSPYWLALLAINTGNSLASVQVETASGGWLDFARATYNYWIASSGAGAGPFTVRLTDTAGHQVTVRDVALEPGAVQDTGVPMYGAGTVAEPAPAAPVTTAGVPASPAAARRPRAPATPTASSATTRPTASRTVGLVPVMPLRPSPSPSC